MVTLLSVEDDMNCDRTNEASPLNRACNEIIFAVLMVLFLHDSFPEHSIVTVLDKLKIDPIQISVSLHII